MSFTAKTLALTFALALSGAGAVSANAQSPDADAARAAWAERHIELVCKPLEAKGFRQRARTCYQNVARATADTSVDFRDVTASLPPARPADAGMAPQGGMNRCVGVACLQRFPMIGVGY